MGSINKHSKSVWEQINTDKLNPVLVNKSIKLKRWPDFGMLEPAPEYLKLSAILSRRKVPTFNLSKISGIDESIINSFINAAHSFNLLDITTEYYDVPTDSEQGFVPINPKQN